MKKLITALTISLILGLTANASNIGKCTGCHGKSFEKPALGKSKIVKDMPLADIKKSLIGYKDGSYGGSMKGIMKGQVATFSEDQIADIATEIKGL